MAKIPIGLQLYSIRFACEKDLPGCLEKVAAMGYEGVEFAGYYGWEAPALRKLLDDNGLVCCGTHAKWPSVQEDELQRTIEFNQILGNRFLIVPSLPKECTGSREAWMETADTFNDIAEKLEGLDMFTGYHNHFTEFQELDGEMPWDTFFSNTRQDVVMQIDVGNALHGGGDPTPHFKRYPGRAITVHVKEWSATDDKALVGEGDVDWPEIFALCETIGKTEWYIVEYERPGMDPLEAVDKCLQNLRAMGK